MVSNLTLMKYTNVSYPTLTEKWMLSNLTLTEKKLVEFLVIVKETKPLQNYLFSLMLRMLGTYRFKTILTILIKPSQGSGSCVYK